MVRCVHEVAGYTNINNGYNIVMSEKLWCSATLWSWRFPKNQLIQYYLLKRCVLREVK